MAANGEGFVQRCKVVTRKRPEGQRANYNQTATVEVSDGTFVIFVMYIALVNLWLVNIIEEMCYANIQCYFIMHGTSILEWKLKHL